MRYGIAAVLFAVSLALVVPVGPVLASKAKVSRNVCKKIAPADGGAYVPGVDARGKKVTGADVAGGASKIKLPKDITFNYGIDMDAKYGLGSSGTSTGESVMGKVTVRGGRVYWNGEPMDGGDQAAIAAECARVYGKK